MPRVAQITGLPRCQMQKYAIESFSLPVVGLRQGYIVAMESQRDGVNQVLIWFVRFSPVPDGKIADAFDKWKKRFEKITIDFETHRSESTGAESRHLDSAEKQAPSSSGTGMKDNLSDKGEDAGSLVDNITLTCRKFIGHPAPEEAASMLDSCLTCLREIARPLPQVCELCEKAPVSRPTLRNGSLGFYCEGCQEKVNAEYARKLQEWEKRPSDIPRGLLYGFVTAVIVGLIFGYLTAAWLPRISGQQAGVLVVFFSNGFIAAPICTAAAAGIGRVDKAGSNVFRILSAFGAFVTHCFFYVFLAQQLTSAPIGIHLVGPALSLFFSSFWSHLLAMLGGMILAMFASAIGKKGSEPEPEVVFEELEPAGEARAN